MRCLVLFTGIHVRNVFHLQLKSYTIYIVLSHVMYDGLSEIDHELVCND